MSQSLTSADVARLLSDPSAEARSDLAATLGRQFSDDTLAPSELAIAQDIVRLLARDVETTVRATLASNIRASRHLPRDVALRLAGDIEAVALPVLADSLVLTDEDLVTLVRQGSPEKQTTIAARPIVPETVADALIDHGHESAVATLVANPGAAVSDAGLERVVDRFPRSAVIHEGMVNRAALPMTVAERLAVLVSRRLQDHLVAHHALPPAMASDLVMRGREEAVIRLSAGSDEPDLLRLVRQMHHSRRLTPSVILRALCTGDIGFFEAALATVADVPIDNARILVHDPGGNGLASLYRKAGLPPALYPVVSAAVSVVDETRFDGGPRDLERFRSRVISRVLTQVETAEPEDMDYLIGKLGDMLMAA